MESWFATKPDHEVINRKYACWTSADALLTWCFGIVMLVAAIPHWENPYYFLGSVYEYKLVDPGIGQLVAMILPLTQLIIAVCLIARILVDASNLIAMFLYDEWQDRMFGECKTTISEETWKAFYGEDAEIPRKEDRFSYCYNGRTILEVEYRDDWTKSRFEETHEDNILNGDLPFRTVYQRCLELAVELDCRNIAFPSISTGDFGFPVKESSVVAIETVCDFLRRLPDDSSLEFVRFCLFSAKDLEIYRAAVDSCRDGQKGVK